MSSIIIGLGGVTNGGKTVLSQRLKTHFEHCEVATLHMDDYYWDDLDPHHIPLPQFDGYADWDIVSAVDWVRMEADLKAWTNAVEPGPGSKRLLLVEGIMIYSHQSLLAYFTKKYFFTLSKDVCWERRSGRTYLPPEPAGYFDQVAWPRYKEHLRDARAQPDIVYLKGTADLAETFGRVCKDIESLL